MPVGEQLEDPSEQAMREQAQAELAKTFEEMPYEIPLLLFTSPLKNDPFCEAARQAIRAIREIAPKITLREYDLSHKIAQKWKAKYSPTLLFDPERYQVRWLGAPVGEEGRTFVEALIMMGFRKTGLSEAEAKPV